MSQESWASGKFLADKTSVVTGCSSGIGQETARLVKRLGGDVLGVDVDDEHCVRGTAEVTHASEHCLQLHELILTRGSGTVQRVKLQAELQNDRVHRHNH